MKILLVRHAEAYDKKKFQKTGRPDSLRPLTKKGRKEMLRVARALKIESGKIDILVSSPYTRARETAEILKKVYRKGRLFFHVGLVPKGHLVRLLNWIQGKKRASRIILVGHEPDLGRLAGWLITGRGEIVFELKKAGAALLEFGSEIRPGKARLKWLMEPRQIKSLPRDRYEP